MQTIRIGHSPDPDDAFMFYALTAGKVRIPGVRIEHVLEDIETLNRRSREAELDVTAVSFATYLLIADRYRMMDPGASMGKGYGPILVAREPVPPAELEQRVTAIAGKHTTSALLLPLGCNVMRRDLGDDLHRALSQALRDSIAWAHAHVDEALEYAMRYGRGIDKETCRRFVLMYVNDFTLALGKDGRAAIERLFTMAHQKGAIPTVPTIDPI